jgi:hypothetical protein
MVYLLVAREEKGYGKMMSCEKIISLQALPGRMDACYSYIYFPMELNRFP